MNKRKLLMLEEYLLVTLQICARALCDDSVTEGMTKEQERANALDVTMKALGVREAIMAGKPIPEEFKPTGTQ